MPQDSPQINKIVVKKYDGTSVSKDDEVAVTLNFPMWFGEELINEINERNITAIIIKDYDGNNHIHLATDDVDLIIAAQKAFWGFRG
jgi:hypothetical protein